nr:trypsin-like peptidase domain-containing protein [Streptomyces sp. RFCAC02]
MGGGPADPAARSPQPPAVPPAGPPVAQPPAAPPAAPQGQQPPSPYAPPAPPAGHQAPPPAEPQEAPGTTVLRALPAGPAPAAPPPALPPADAAGPGMPPPAAPWSAFPEPAPRRKRRNGLVIATLVAALVAGGVGGGVGYLVADDDGTSASSAALNQGSEDGPAARPPDSVAGIADAALPSVVTIEAGTATEGSTGTGFVYDEDGHILTNNHVVASAADGGTLTVTFSDGETYNAEVVGRAEGYDVAVIRLTDLNGRELTPLPLGDSDAMAVGDATIAIGAPFGLSGTVTTGIISAKDRPVASSDATGTSASYMNALQTDASINPGNSGGPLLNADGEVIGINSAIRSTGDGMTEAGSIGLGFAIPINQAKRVAEDLIEGGEPIYPIIGASVNSGQTQQTAGAQIVERTGDGTEPVTPGGPAAEAGLQAGDVITEFGGRAIDSGPTLISQIWTYEPGDSVELTYERDGEEHTTTIVLGQREGD